ncbi:NADPH-dependent FMN reductase [Pseudoxanthomonas daejeonensis]|nr:NADPH-dependent FMN reductase [Pseudoxanthomonas daejeonensis]
MKLLALSGSTRRDSWNTRLLHAAAAAAPAGAEVARAPDLAALPHFSEDIEAEAFARGPVATFVAAVHAADVLLVATPEYNQSIPGTLKNALDWLSRGADADRLAGKPVAVAGATVGPWGTRLAQAHLRHVLGVIGLRVVGPGLFVAGAASRWEAETGRWDDALQVRLQAWLHEVAAAAGAV